MLKDNVVNIGEQLTLKKLEKKNYLRGLFYDNEEKYFSDNKSWVLHYGYTLKTYIFRTIKQYESFILNLQQNGLTKWLKDGWELYLIFKWKLTYVFMVKKQISESE